MQPLLNDIIHKSQTGFMQERSIFYNIFMFWELTALAKEKDVDLVVLLLDFEKAYDRVDWSFLEEVMLQLGFPMAWVVAIRALYKNASSSVYVAGEVDAPFSISRSVRQGCPLAPFLYLLIVEAFHVYFNNHALRIKGLQWGVDNKQVLDTEFADDTTLYVDGEEHNLRNVQCVVQEFCELSGAIINWNKSIGIRMKNNGVSHWLPHPDFQWL